VGRMRGWVHRGCHIDIGTIDALARANHDADGVNSRRHIGTDGLRPAIFLDRDGVLLKHVHYISDVDDVQVIAGAPQAVTALRDAGYACVVVSNQSAVGRGLITEEQVAAVNERMSSLFAADGAVFDAIYHCPVAPIGADPTIVEHHDRKPGPGMLQRGARELKLDLARSWMIGDSISDILAGINAGCRGTVLVKSGVPLSDPERYSMIPRQTAADLAAAVDLVVEVPAVA
jgi:D-glycero-D-manno-heptose 1,7-bisphosphate phosphatase